MAMQYAIRERSRSDLTASATWGLVDSTSYLNSETGSEVLTTGLGVL